MYMRMHIRAIYNVRNLVITHTHRAHTDYHANITLDKQ